MVWLRGEEGSSSESRLRLKRERPPVSLPSDDNPLMMRSWATGKRCSAPCDSTLIEMLRHGAHHVHPRVSGILRSAASRRCSRIENLLSENRELKQRFKMVERDMRAILNEYETSQHPVVVALQCLFLNALNDDDILEDINDQEHEENMMEAVHLLNMISRIASFRALSAVPSKFTLNQLQWPFPYKPASSRSKKRGLL